MYYMNVLPHMHLSLGQKYLIASQLSSLVVFSAKDLFNMKIQAQAASLGSSLNRGR